MIRGGRETEEGGRKGGGERKRGREGEDEGMGGEGERGGREGGGGEHLVKTC